MNKGRKELAEIHFYLIELVVDRLLKSERYSDVRDLKDDLVSNGSIYLLHAAKEYDPTRKVLFKTFASSKIRGSCKDYIKKVRRERNREVYLEDIPVELYESLYDSTEQEVNDESELIQLLEPTSKLQKEVYYRCILNDEPEQSVADSLKVSRGTVTKVKQRLKDKFKEILLSQKEYKKYA